MPLLDRLNQAAARLSDDELEQAIHSAQRCAMCTTRTMRDLALMRLRCLRCELDRRAGTRATEQRSSPRL